MESNDHSLSTIVTAIYEVVSLKKNVYIDAHTHKRARTHKQAHASDRTMSQTLFRSAWTRTQQQQQLPPKQRITNKKNSLHFELNTYPALWSTCGCLLLASVFLCNLWRKTTCNVATIRIESAGVRNFVFACVCMCVCKCIILLIPRIANLFGGIVLYLAFDDLSSSSAEPNTFPDAAISYGLWVSTEKRDRRSATGRFVNCLPWLSSMTD